MRRVVRGGAFNNTSRNVRCAYRNDNNPNNRNDNIGFRVVASHDFFSGSRKYRAGMGLPGRGKKDSATRSRLGQNDVLRGANTKQACSLGSSLEHAAPRIELQ